MRDILIAVAFFAILGAIISASRLIQAEMRKRNVPERYIAAVRIIETVATMVVRALNQRVVSDLKDPRKPGEWTAVAARAVKEQAVESTKAFSDAAVKTLQEQGLSDKTIDELIDTSVEAGVTALKSAAPVVMTATASADPPRAEVTTDPART